MPSQSLLKVLTLALATVTVNAAIFDTHHGNAHVNRGLVHRHRAHQQPAPSSVTSEYVKMVPRAGAAYNETDHDSSASIEIGGQQQTSAVSSVVPVSSVVTSSSAVVSTTSSSTVVSSSSTPSVAVSSSSSSIPSVTSTSTVLPTAAATSSSSSIVPSSSSSSLETSSTTEQSSSSSSSSSTSTESSSSSSSTTQQIVSTVRSTVTDSAEVTPQSTTRSARTGVVSTKTASTTATASAAAASAGGSSSGMSSGTKTAIIVVCVVGGIALAAFALWTIIRRWKLRPTKRFDGRMRPLTFSPTTPDAFYEKTQHRHSANSITSTSSADRQRRQFVDELDQEQYGHAQQYDMAGLPVASGAAAGYLTGVPSHDFTAGVATSYPHQETYDQDEGYADLRRGPSFTTTTFAGVGAGGAGLPSHGGAVSPMHAAYPAGAQGEPYRDDASDQGYHHAPAQGLAREPSLGRPTRGEGPYAAATHFAGSGPRY